MNTNDDDDSHIKALLQCAGSSERSCERFFLERFIFKQ